MTETPLSISTQIATPIQTVFHSAASISANDAPSATEPVEENPDEYTIKCICDWSEDDGNTIYCETCNTWQHIECFYPGRAEETSHPDFAHSCADCKPRPLDRRRAIEWQRSQSHNKVPSDNGDKKTKRPTSKSHKKKTKPSDLQVNGYHDHDGHRNGSPQDHHPHIKKPKGHRSTQSVSSQIKRTPPYNARTNSHTHPPSPAHTPPDLPKDFEVHSFSETFQHLYDNDQSFQLNDYNTYPLEVTNRITSWLHDPGKLLQDTGVESEKDAFQRIKPDSKATFADLRVDQREVMINDMSRRFCSLIPQMPIKDDCAIGELNGLVGFQKDYCTDPSNRWQEFVHPKPFVFFPSHLPLYIDARNQGSDCRYARRSCRPNATVDTMIAHGSDYHFWLVSEGSIPAGEQITIPWDFRFSTQIKSRFLHLLNLGDTDGPPFDGADITEEEYEQLTNVTHLVLSEYGGCACELGNDCAFARFHRNYHGRLHNQPNGVKSKKVSTSRKSKQSHVSPTSTGHATNSRAASEGQQDQYDEDDSRSVSGSVRSKPHSRDLTPLHGVGDTNGILTEPSDREKRKLAALEDSFRKMEQGQPSRKKKRTSEGSTIGQASATPPVSKPRQRSVVPRPILNTNGSRTNKYVDASTSRRESDSPFNAGSPTGPVRSPGNSISRNGSVAYRSRQTSMIPSRSYTDASTQTDEVENAWYSRPCATPSPKRPIISLSKRLLRNRLKLQAQIEARQVSEDQSVLGSPTVSMDMDRQDDVLNPESPTDPRGRNASIVSSTPSVDASAAGTDVIMSDAPAILVGNSMKPAPPPWPGQSSISYRSTPIPTQKSPDLRVQMPPTPSFSNPNMSGPGTLSGNVTPSSAAGSIAQSPFGTIFPSTFPAPIINGAVQSPAKVPKKLSLSDYKAARAKKAEVDLASKKPGSSPTVPPAVLKPSLSTIEEAKASGILEGSASVDTPTTEKALDPIASSARLLSTDPSPKPNLPSELSNGHL
jgi:hypothetical protein